MRAPGERDRFDTLDGVARVGLAALPVVAHLLYLNVPGFSARLRVLPVPALLSLVVVLGIALVFRRLGDPRFPRNWVVYGLLSLGLYFVLSPVLETESLLDATAALTSYVLPGWIQSMVELGAQVIRWETFLLLALFFSLGERSGALFCALVGFLALLFATSGPYWLDVGIALLWLVGLAACWTAPMRLLVPWDAVRAYGLSPTDAAALSEACGRMMDRATRQKGRADAGGQGLREFRTAVMLDVMEGLLTDREIRRGALEQGDVRRALEFVDARCRDIAEGQLETLPDVVPESLYRRFLGALSALGSGVLLLMGTGLILLGTFIPGPFEELIGLALSSPSFMLLGRWLLAAPASPEVHPARLEGAFTPSFRLQQVRQPPPDPDVVEAELIE